MKKKQRKKSHILLPDNENAKNDNGNFFICIIRFFFIKFTNLPLSTTTMPASRSLVVVWPVSNTICCFHFRSAQISFPHEKIVIASYPFGIIDRHALWEVSFPLQLRILTLKSENHDCSSICFCMSTFSLGYLLIPVYGRFDTKTFRYKNVSLQVVSIQTEFNLMHQQSRFEASD